ncbi:hypothetical protein Egran_04458 [Elaphomyces granulatus]|uniref:LysM domain-containing protein n=1 Tax=Elaphomyces granulatus TaxID=519963 RepID=A0A232LVB7_9EURO|nr:hypothetical protein Egran_04458 [Elaphomyces granulatus]
MFSVAVFIWLLPVVTADQSYFFFSNQTDSLFDTVSAGCNTALTAALPQCPKELLDLLGTGDYLTLQNDTVMDALCSQDCPTALSSYRSQVVSACANDPQPVDGFPSTYWVDATSSVFTQACLKDSQSGQYCTDILSTTLGDATDPTAVLGGYNASGLCSECVVNLFRHQQSTPYSNYDPDMAVAWAAIQSNCGLSYPTATPTLQTNVSLGNYAPSGYPTASCLSARTYTVVGGDNCEAIAESHQVSTGALIAVNSLRIDCTDIFAGQVCDTLQFQNRHPQLDVSINSYRAAESVSPTAMHVLCRSEWRHLRSNCQLILDIIPADYLLEPQYDNYCTNLIAGQNICVGPPGGFQNFTTIAGASVTQTALYATTTAARPSPVASGTTPRCGKYYQVQAGDYCQLVALNATISLNLFEAINPQIDNACDNLLTGFYYCVLPTQDWNATATSSTIVTAPTTIPSGTTSNCYQYYVIQPNDYCAKIENQFDITFAQLQQWNPSLLSDCSNLELGEAYCVNGASSAFTTPTSSSAGAVKLRRDSVGPVQTPPPMPAAGGVPVGWPGLKSHRLMVAMGLSPPGKF